MGTKRTPKTRPTAKRAHLRMGVSGITDITNLVIQGWQEISSPL